MKKGHALLIVIGFCICFLIGMFIGRSSIGRNIFSPFNDMLLETESISVPGLRGDGKVDLNTATKEQLMLLPGIGEKLAVNILQFRDKHGPFAQVQDILLVEGITTSVFTQCAIYLSVGGTYENSGS